MALASVSRRAGLKSGIKAINKARLASLTGQTRPYRTRRVKALRSGGPWRILEEPGAAWGRAAAIFSTNATDSGSIPPLTSGLVGGPWLQPAKGNTAADERLKSAAGAATLVGAPKSGAATNSPNGGKKEQPLPARHEAERNSG